MMLVKWEIILKRWKQFHEAVINGTMGDFTAPTQFSTTIFASFIALSIPDLGKLKTQTNKQIKKALNLDKVLFENKYKHFKAEPILKCSRIHW